MKETKLPSKSRKLGLLTHIAAPVLVLLLLARGAGAEGVVYTYSIIGTLNYVQGVLTRVGPMLSAVLFIVAGIFYAVGQVLPPDKKANFHTTSINVIIGAIIVAVLSVASNGLALASTHLLVNITSNSIG